MFDYPELAATQLILIGVGVMWLLRRNDEVPLLISCFIFYISSYRFWAVTSGKGEWANITNFGFDPITDQEALVALADIVFGQLCLLAAYILQQGKTLPVIVPVCDRPFLRWLRAKVIFFGLLFLPAVVVVRSRLSAQLSTGGSLAFGNGYAYLFPMLLIGIATLIFCLWRFRGLSSWKTKIAAFLILGGVAYLTYDPSSRFRFVAWIISGGVIFSSCYRPRTRLILFTIVAVITISLFTVAGALRNPNLSGDALNQAATERAFAAEDANMLDGFALMQQVYPKLADFRWGMEHFEILTRPIPRALWPDKPIGGGAMAKLGLVDANKGSTLGISPSLFGSFYSEGGLGGIAILSVFYGSVFARVIRASAGRQPFAGILMRAVLAACLVPLLRGGDLPGIYAWFGMSFWPCFLLLWVKRRDFKKRPLFPTLPAYRPSLSR